jgi:AMP nucleosidase
MKQEPTDPRRCATPAEAVKRLSQIYADSLDLIRRQYTGYVAGKDPDPAEAVGVYPQISVEISPEKSIQTSRLSMGRIASTNLHATTVTQPDLFADYLLDQLERIAERFDPIFRVEASREPIPLPFALDPFQAQDTQRNPMGIQRHFYTPNLMEMNDEIVDGRQILKSEGALPLSLFTAQRTDYSLYRLHHYTATSPRHFQRFVLFTNYQRYVDEFLEYAEAELAAGRAEAIVEPGDRVTTAKQGKSPADASFKMPQMPAYHLVRKNRMGDTLVNIGVGPSNAKTITDHIAVLRPHSWLMIGHCGGLRRTQQLGDYVLAHAYLRDDGVLDDALPPSIPLPTIAEVQLALTGAVRDVTGCTENELKRYLRTGTVVTTGDRNWELSFDRIAERLNKSRAIAIDMESATIAANGYRYRVPYGTLLCVSDKPLHGELKLPGMANTFYQQRIGQHLEISLRANDALRGEAEARSLHSRKLRSFDEPLFQ